MNPVSRRAFLATSAAAATAALLPARSLHAAASKPVGLQLYSVRNELPKDYPGTLKKLAGIGYREVEAAGFYNHPATEVKQMMSDAGIRCVSAHYPLGDLLKNADATVDYASTLGLEYVICSSPNLPDPTKAATYPGGLWGYMMHAMTADDWKWNAEQFNTLGAKFKARGIQFGYHNHTPEFRDLGDGQYGYQFLVKNSDPKLVVFELDCGWAWAAGKDPAKLLREHSKRIVMIHLKDFAPAAAGADPDKHTPTVLGYGAIDFGPILAAAKAIGVKHAFVEQEAFDMPPFDELKLDFDNITTLIGGGTVTKPS